MCDYEYAFGIVLNLHAVMGNIVAVFKCGTLTLNLGWLGFGRWLGAVLKKNSHFKINFNIMVFR